MKLRLILETQETNSINYKCPLIFRIYYNEWRAEHAQSLEKAKEQGIEQGRAEVYEVIDAWNKRRLEAEAKGIPFNEPPPPQNGHPHG